MNRLELNGNWELRDAAGELLCPVEIPGSVISGLYASGKIAHPYYRENEYAVRELFWKDYQFVRTFAVDEALLSDGELTLVWESVCVHRQYAPHVSLFNKRISAFGLQ